jgi:ABC-type transporter Mla subunit MlaD
MATYPEATFKTNALSEAISQLGTKIDKLADSISAQNQNIGRLERAVTDLLTGINAQRETMAQMMTQHGEFLKLATRQADIIGALSAGTAS